MWTACLFFVLFAIHNTMEIDAAPSYVVTIPPSIRPGEYLVVYVDIFNTKQPVDVTVRMSFFAHATKRIPAGQFKSTAIALKVPYNTPKDSYDVEVSGSGGMSFSTKTPIKYSSSVVIFIQTDRGMYAENENVKSRILAFYPDMRPYVGTINVELFNGEDMLVRQWKGVSGAEGVFINEFSIGVDPKLGTWRLRATVKEHSTEKTFVVRKYVIPKFKVNINCNPKTITSTTGSIKCTVSSRFTFGKDVNGTLRFQAVTQKNVFLINKYSDIVGSKIITVPLAGKNVDSDIDIIAQVGDTATGTTVTNEIRIAYKGGTALLWTLEPRRDTFVPGLSFVSYMKYETTRSKTVQVEVMITEVKIKTCRKRVIPYDYQETTSSTITVNVNVDANGYGRISLQPKQDARTITLSTYEGTSKKSVTISAAQGSGQSIIMTPVSGFINVGSPFRFDLTSNQALVGRLVYEVYSRGRRVSRGGLKAAGTKIQTISIPAIPDFYPSAAVLVYLSKTNGDILMDRAVFHVIGNSLNNFVSLVGKPSELKPGETVTLEVGSMANSTVYVMSVDAGVQAFQTGYDVLISDVNSALQNFHDQKSTDVVFLSNRYTLMNKKQLPTTCEGMAPIVPVRRRINKFSRVATNVRKDNSIRPIVAINPIEKAVRPAVNVDVKVDVNVNIDIILPARLQPKEQRVWFPKTWLWESVLVGESNLTTIQRKVPDSITTWSTSAFSVHDTYGFGILNNPLKTMVAQDFFIEVTIPEFAYVGCSLLVKVTIFNYTPNPKPTLIQMFYKNHFEGLSRTVPAEGSTMLNLGLEIKTEQFGDENITIIARDGMTFQILDHVKKLLVVKPPGVEQDYNIPYLISLTRGQIGMVNDILLTLPNNTVSGTKKVYATVTGDILAPSMQGLESLIRMPTGCGEQTMMYLAPNIYVLEYLIATAQITEDILKTALERINKGKDKELSWRRPEGAFAVWGTRSPKGSIWLTSFVLRCFHTARKHIPIADYIFTEGIQWLVNTQQGDGSFVDDNMVIHYQMLGGVRGNTVAMTSYVLLTLLENNDIDGYVEEIKDAKNKAVNYILANMNALRGNQHGLALASYALFKAGQTDKANELYQLLVAESINKDGMMYWKKGCQGRCKRAVKPWQSPNPRAQPIDIETASYALLYLTEGGMIEDAMRVTKWLTSQRNPTGGFTTSQDTVVSLEALSKLSTLLKTGGDKPTDLTIMIKTEKNKKENVKINNNNRQLVQKIELPSDTDAVQVVASGHGIGLVDVVVSYSVYTEDLDPAFNIRTTVDAARQTFDTISVQVCVSRKEQADNRMVVVEVGVPSGFKGDHDRTRGTVKGLKHVESDYDGVNFYFDSIGVTDTCFYMTAGRIDKVTQSQAIPVFAYDYYEPVNQGMGNYTSGKLSDMTTLCEQCQRCSICEKKVIG